MDVSTFRKSLSADMPPTELSSALQALWYDAKGNWHQAHEQLQGEGDVSSDWVHAYLHRKEGDAANAAYWYRRDGRPVAQGTLEDEWDAIVRELTN